MRYLTNDSTDPHWNMAFDEMALTALTAPEPVFYLWQNRPAVIIGRNQSAPAEVNLPYLEEHGIVLARRVTGGGAVYHDLGNLNYSFVGGVREMDALQPVELMACALRSLGIPAEVSGRNDILVEGRKCSGYAKRLSGTRMMIHGTLMWNVDLTALTAALSVPGSKFDQSSRAEGLSFRPSEPSLSFRPSEPSLSFRPSEASLSFRPSEASGEISSVMPDPDRASVTTAAVPSVRSRVCNLSEYLPALTLSDFRARLHDFLAAYSLQDPASSLRAEGCGKTNLMSATASPTRGPVRTARLPHPSATPASGSPVIPSDSEESVTPAFLEQVNTLADSKFRSWDWIHGRSPATDFTAARKFPSCGTVRVHFSVRRGLLTDVSFTGDFLGALSLDTPLPSTPCSTQPASSPSPAPAANAPCPIPAASAPSPTPLAGKTLPEALNGTRFEPTALTAVLSTLPIASYFDGLTAADLAALFLGGR